MLNDFTCMFLALVRNKGVVTWSLMLPIALLAMFTVMFSGLDGSGQIEPIDVVVVEDAAYADDAGFRGFVEGLSAQDASSDGALLDVTFAPNAAEAEAMAAASAATDDPYIAVLSVDADGRAHVLLNDVATGLDANMYDVYQSVVLAAADGYESRRALMAGIAAENHEALAGGAVSAALQHASQATEKISITRGAPKESARYYFALLGFSTMMNAQNSLIAVHWLLPSASALGARRTVGGTSRVRALAGTLLACFAVSLICLMVVYLFMRFAVGVDFAGRDAACIAGLAASSAMAVALGAAVAVVPKMGQGAKVALMIALVSVCSLFAGLYGRPAMEFADMVAGACPWASFANPAAQVSQAMYSILYYDTLAPFAGHVCVLLAMTAVLFAVSAATLRRQRHASL